MTEPVYAQRYKLKKRLPGGAAEAVYQASDATGRPVVVSVVRPADPDGFLRAMGLIGSVRHLDLAAVVDAGRDGPECFVVGEDPGGADVASLVARGLPPVATAAMMGAQAAAGVAALHERGLVHGGLEPATVRQGADGTVKVTGAGLAAACPPPDLAPGSPPENARYLSPEEVAGRAPSPASDVYRLGLILYLLLTGRHAFDGIDAQTVAREQLDGIVQPPQIVNPEVPPALAQVVMRALEKDPDRRGSATDLKVGIERVLSAAQVRPAPEKPPSRAWIWVLAIVVIALVAAAVAAWQLGAFGGDSSAGKVAVPNLVGMTATGAGNALSQKGLETGKITYVQSTEAPQDTVVTQSPGAGAEVDKGTKVDLEVVANASPTAPAGVSVPDVVGSTQSDAEAKLSDAGFAVAVSQATSETVASGIVIEQGPSGGVMAAEGSTVRIVVSTGSLSPTPSASP